MLEPDVKPQHRSWELWRKRAVILGRDNQAFESAPGKADREQLQTIDHRGYGFVGNRIEDDAEEAARAGEVAFPDRVALIVVERRIKHAGDLGLRLQPRGKLNGAFLM